MDMNNKDFSILVVDDEEMIVSILLNFLGEKGYQVTGIKDSAEAIELVKTRTFDIVFTDLMMPGINGIELVKEISQQNVDTQIIIFTGYASIESAIDAVQQGVYDYLKKPFRLEDIDKVLGHALDKLILERENLALQQRISGMLAQITMLYDISNIIYQVREKKYAVEMLFDTLSESMNIKIALLCEHTEKRGKFKPKYVGKESSEFENIFHFSVDSILNNVPISLDDPTILKNIGSEMNLDGTTVTLPTECLRIVFIPIKYQGELEGFLIIIEQERNEYPFEDELTLLKILATQIAPIIGSRAIHHSDILESKEFEPSRAFHNLIKAGLTLGASAGTPVSYALVRLMASSASEIEMDFSLIRESWRNIIATQLGPDKRVHWAGIDTLIILAMGGNPVGLDHHLANVRDQIESSKIEAGRNVKLSMAYSIVTYPFDADSAKKISAKLSSQLFYDASGIKFN